MKLSLAASPYFWTKDQYFSFYQAVANSPVDTIYLGETVCSKRREMNLENWLEIASILTAQNKQVILSTMTLIEAASEFKAMNKICSQTDLLVEANDMAAIYLLSENELPFVVGTAINLYNATSFKRLAKLGMKRWIVPVELGKEDILPLLKLAKEQNVEVEYQAFGRMPLAYSARCFTARHHQLPKDDCQLKCLNYEDGILVKTQEGDSFAQINGIQTQSAKVSNLYNQLTEMQEIGIDYARIVPVKINDTLKVIEQFKQPAPQLFDNLNGNYEFCNGYWFQIEGMKLVS